MSQVSQVRFLDRQTPPHISTLIIMTGVSAMAMNMFLPSLPSMTEYFHTEYRLMQLSVALFLGVNGVLQLVLGPLSDRYGRRPVTLWGFAIFIVASLGCIYSTDVVTFLVFRMFQAASVVAIVLSRAAIRDVMDQDRSAAMIGYVTMGMAVTPMISPALGGWLDQVFGWQATFWVLLSCGVLTLALLWADFGETNHRRATSFGKQIRDIPELLASPRFWGYAMVTALSSGAFFAYLGGAPFVGSVIFGLDPAALGFYFGAPAAGYILGNYISARNAVRIGIDRLILTGILITMSGLIFSLAIFLAGAGSAVSFFGLMTTLGLGNGLVIPNGIAGSLSVRPHLAGTASGLGGALMIGGGAALSAYAGSLLTPGSGPFPLLYIQMVVTALALGCILLVIRRARRLARG